MPASVLRVERIGERGFAAVKEQQRSRKAHERPVHALTTPTVTKPGDAQVGACKTLLWIAALGMCDGLRRDARCHKSWLGAACEA